MTYRQPGFGLQATVVAAVAVAVVAVSMTLTWSARAQQTQAPAQMPTPEQMLQIIQQQNQALVRQQQQINGLQQQMQALMRLPGVAEAVQVQSQQQPGPAPAQPGAQAQQQAPAPQQPPQAQAQQQQPAPQAQIQQQQQPAAQAQAQQQRQPQATTEQRPVGEEDPEAERRQIEISGVREAGGILTPAGSFVFEPSIEYEQSSSNVTFFNGLEIIDTVLIGDIEINEADRDTLIASGDLRYGITNRFEIGAKVPFVYRSDKVTNQDVSTGTESDSSLDAANLGDIEVRAGYQFNSGNNDWPIFVGNLRFKTDTGVGPFDVDFDEDGIAEELATGSGFFGLEPNMTVVFPSDPAVLFANVSYLWNIPRDVDETVGGNEIGRVDPGDVIGVGFGMGLALNDEFSISLGYAHSFVLETTTETNGVDLEGDSFDVGRLRLGFNYRPTPDYSINMSVEAGITDDAPDVLVRFSSPFSFRL